jgi:hypothetical protein
MGSLGSGNESLPGVSGKSNTTQEPLEYSEDDRARSKDVDGNERWPFRERLDRAIGNEELGVDLVTVTSSAVPSTGVRSPRS